MIGALLRLLPLHASRGRIARNPYKPAVIIGTIAAAVNAGLGLILLGIFSAPILAIPAGMLAGWSVVKTPRFAARTGSAGALAGAISGFLLALGSSLSGAAAATIGSLIPPPTPSSPSSSDLRSWSPELYLTFMLFGLFVGIVAFFVCVITATIVGATSGWRNRPVPTFPVIYE